MSTPKQSWQGGRKGLALHGAVRPGSRAGMPEIDEVFNPDVFTFAPCVYRVHFKNGNSGEFDGAALATHFPFDPAQIQRIEAVEQALAERAVGVLEEYRGMFRRLRRDERDLDEITERAEEVIEELERVPGHRRTNLCVWLGPAVPSQKEKENHCMNQQLSSTGQRPYLVTHIDGTPLKTGNSIQLVPVDPGGASIAQDVAAQPNSIASGNVKGGANVQTGLRVDVKELDSNGNVVDSTFFLLDITAGTGGTGGATNLAVLLGDEVPQPAGGVAQAQFRRVNR